ncbi:serine/threonine phosphatase [Clostridia bacterium]|nr:serine/threonine phosphatase [Clostridia bacterium]
MNKLCADIGYMSINHIGEELCGDTVNIVTDSDGNSVIVLADGMGSGVKACILSTLTAKILSTMLNAGLPLKNCVETIVETLPVCSVRGVAYSTFTVIKIFDGEFAEIYQYENPKVILFRNGHNIDYPTVEITYSQRKVLQTHIKLEENDVIIAMSDGCPYAGMGTAFNWGWKREDIIAYIEPLTIPGAFNAKALSKILIDEVNAKYELEPGDDATVCTVRMQKRTASNILFGPPSNKFDGNRMMSLFFSKVGKHIICGGTTSTIAAEYLGKSVIPTLDFYDNKIPPIAKIDGVDLVTEGVITMNRVIEYAKDYVNENELYHIWSVGRDGASLISRILFEEATDINFYVGRAVNPAHQTPDLPITFNIKMQLVKELEKYLLKMGKYIRVSYF